MQLLSNHELIKNLTKSFRKIVCKTLEPNTIIRLQSFKKFIINDSVYSVTKNFSPSQGKFIFQKKVIIFAKTQNFVKKIRSSTFSY